MYLHSDGVLFLWSVELDGGDAVLRGDQQHLEGFFTSLCSHLR